MHKLLFLSLFIFLSQKIVAQPSPQLSASEIQLELQKLNVLGSVLFIAAHPDDENTRLLAYLSKEKLYRVGYLSLTRGDGGQNLIGEEQGEELGLIRTQELLAARRIDGAEQFFTRAYDFGYSKSPEETFAFWNKDSILADVVYIIRYFQPDIIISRFPATGEGGHGHHTASAILAEEAFTAAADAKRFPEEKFGKVWQAKRLLWNVFSGGSNTAATEGAFKVDVGGYNALLGKSYGEISAESRTMHKSQGFGSLKIRGSRFEYFKTILGDPPVNDLMDGVNTTWSRLEGSEGIQEWVNEINEEFDPSNPSSSVSDLLKFDSMMTYLKQNYWRSRKLTAIENLITSCCGLWFEIVADEPISSIDTIRWKMQMINRSDIKIVLNREWIGGWHHKQFDTILLKNQLFTLNSYSIRNLSQGISQPFWLELPRTSARYQIPLYSWIVNPDSPDLLFYQLEFFINGTSFQYLSVIPYKYEDPVKGEIYQPAVIAPPVTANFEASVIAFNNLMPKPVKVNIKSFVDSVHMVVKLKTPEGWRITPEAVEYNLQKKGDESSITFYVSVPDRPLAASIDTLKAVIEYDDEEYTKGIRTISYDHIPTITYFPDATAKLVSFPLATAGKNIGYLEGAGDKIPDMLREIGYTVTLLTENEIALGQLDQYDAIITGIRAYNTVQFLKQRNDKLLEYVENGGTLLVQYNTTADLIMEDIGPYPFKISRGRVTDETATVNFINPKDPILNFPNKITEKDFEGWIQERGLYFLTEADSNYRKVFTMNDKGEEPLDGSLLVANYGKGKYVYTSLSFFRELPAGVPGAYRLFVNLISNN